MDLHQSHKTKRTWIPDANQWTYTNLTKQKETWIPDANQWTYTNLLKQNTMPDANQWTYNSLLPYHRIQLPINGLMLASSMVKAKCYKAKFMK